MELPSVPLALPMSLADLRTFFNVTTEMDLLRILGGEEPLSNSQAIVRKYSGGSFSLGRSMNSTIIVMAGATGAGKSSTINALFDDNSLCTTNENTSETSKITLIQKNLHVTNEDPSIKTKLTFVDVPGMFDTNANNELRNYQIMKYLKQSLAELQDRLDIPWALRNLYQISTQVYPNLVLFVVNVTDNRMDGEDSKLMRSLRQLKNNGDLIDHKNLNLIVVLTHVMGLPPKRFEQLLQQRKDIVRNAVKKVLGIRDVPIVPVENQPEEYDMEKDGDFYLLSNGERSHWNLYDAMQACLNDNKDLLARVSIAWYFQPSCPDRLRSADVTEINVQVPPEDPTTALESINAYLKNLDISSILTKLPPKPLDIHYLGYGFCPVTERIKQSPLKAKTEETVKIADTEYSVPWKVSVILKSATNYFPINFYSKEDYEKHMANKYNLDDEVKLLVRAKSQSKWIRNQRKILFQQPDQLSVLCGMQAAILDIKNPENHSKVDKFDKQINSLPDEFNETSSEEFRSFFYLWGTHLICKVGVGGSVQLNCTMATTTVITKDNLSEIQNKILDVFKGMLSSDASSSISQQVDQLRNSGVKEEELEFVGGDPPVVMDLGTMNGETLKTWTASVAATPAELQHHVKFFPYYEFVKGKRAKALKEATEKYLRDDMPIKPIKAPTRRNDAAEKVLTEVKEEDGSNCFPAGTMIYLNDGANILIENLHQLPSNKEKLMLTIGVTGMGEKLKLGNLATAQFCTYLDAKKTQVTDYLCIQLDNGRKLLVSPGHMIFQYHGNGVVKGKQAKYLQLGDQVVYANRDGTNDNLTLGYPAIQKIIEERHVGAYCPLTTSGTFFADGVMVSSYSNTDYFQLGQTSLAPLKLYSMMCSKRSAKEKEGIHPYAKCLISLRKSLTFYQHK